MRFLHVRFCSVSVRKTELSLTCSVQFGQNGKTLLRCCKLLVEQVAFTVFSINSRVVKWLAASAALMDVTNK